MLDPNKLKTTEGYIHNADDSLETAQWCKSACKYNRMTSNMYYYLFNLCRALETLIYEDTKSHKALIGNFNKHFIHELGVFDSSVSGLIVTMENQRSLCDYESNYIMDKELALYLFEQSLKAGGELKSYYDMLVKKG